MKEVGWILDIYIGNANANLWVKLNDGRVIRLTDCYRPDFYVELKSDIDLEDIAEAISLHHHVLRAEVEEKYTSIFDRVKSKVVHVFTYDTSSFSVVKNDLEKLDVVKSWFNIDLYHFQRYLFAKSFAPTNKVKVEWSELGKLVDTVVIDDSCEIEPPPFSWLLFEIGVKSKKLTPNASQDPIERITLQSEKGKVETLKGGEADVLARFASHVSDVDPDFLVANEYENTLRYIFERSKILDIEIQLGREPIQSYNLRRVNLSVRGRVLVNMYAFREYGVVGICELSRFTLAPPTYSTKWSAGKRIDARQNFEALKKDILVPKRRGFPRFSMTAREIYENDRGGLLFSPVMGLHENVAELDFESMFPNIIIHHNISYETVTPTHVDRSRQGFLGGVVKVVLDRRLWFKHLRKKFRKNSDEYRWCDQRQKALKCVLVCIYGFSGCFANRFNNVVAYNEINAVARRILVQTVNICLARGFEILYGNTDSIFVKRPDTTQEDYEELAKTIEKETCLPIALDNHYKFIVFMKQKTHPDIEAMNHFFGKLTNGEFNCRGIELRRRDCPVFLKEFQRRLIEILFDAKNPREVIESQVAKAKTFIRDTYHLIMSGDVDSDKLVVSKRVRRNLNTYKIMFPQVVAARLLAKQGKIIAEGATVDFVYVNANHGNPFRRVLPVTMGSACGYYDREKYGNMVLDAAETILSTFGFSRQRFGLALRTKSLWDFIIGVEGRDEA
ncbi:hypothetical protein DRO66_04030 [Candidatus Bathyarchaeota archaeon]|nr:MAG: hypothetical protein DRO66_04030 [Candidatus Bathyarchaeota archaeon]